MTGSTGRAAGSHGEGEPPRYSLMIDVAGRRAVVVGGGRVALRRTRTLLESGANVVVIAPTILPELAALPVTVLPRRYRDGDLAAAWLVHAATDDPLINAQVAGEAERTRIWCVRADDAASSPAWTPAVSTQGEITVAVTSGGDPVRSQRLRAARSDCGPRSRPLWRPARSRCAGTAPRGPATSRWWAAAPETPA